MKRDPLLIARIASLPFDRLEELHAGEALPALESVCDRSRDVDEAAVALEDELFLAAGPGTTERPSDLGAPVGGGTALATTPVRLLMIQARRAVHQRRRSSILAAARELEAHEPAWSRALVDFVDLLDELAASLERYRARHDGAVSRTADSLLAAGAEPRLAEALRLVGRSLAEKVRRLPRWAEWKHRERHTALKLVGYLSRAATKTSPNGVFCATTLARFGARARCFGENDLVARDALIAVGEARKIAACLAIDPEFAPLVRPRPNPTLRETEDRWSFWRPASSREPTDDEVGSSARAHPIARAVLDACAPDRDFGQVIAEASRQTGVAIAALEPFARAMVDRGLLIAEVEIPWSERRPLRRLARQAREAGCAAAWTDRLEEIEGAVDRFASTPWPERGALLDRLSRQAEDLPHRRALHHDELLRVDAGSGLELELPNGVIADLERFVTWYARLYGSLYPRERFVESYARRFLASFPADTDVPLLDLYHGAFEPTGDPRPSAFPRPGGSGPLADRARRAFERLRDRLTMEAALAEREGRDEVDLQTLDWGPIFDDTPPPRWSCGVLFQVAARDTEAIEAGRYRLALNGIYAGGGLAVARLAHLHAGGAPVEESPIAREVKRTWAGLEREGVIVAEVSYMHGGRTANAGLRPSLFTHEIELPGDRVTPGREVVPLRELTVRFESEPRRFRLRWPAREVDVLPIVASGISPEGFVSFLLAIGRQDLQPLALFPGLDAEGIRRWPRYRYGRVVLFRRRWTFAPEDRPFTAPLGFLDHRRRLELARWRRRHGLPRHVFVWTRLDPKPFYVDLESPWLIERLEQSLAAAPDTTLEMSEMLPGPDELWARDGAGRYATEFLVHLDSVDPAEGPRA